MRAHLIVRSVLVAQRGMDRSEQTFRYQLPGGRRGSGVSPGGEQS